MRARRVNLAAFTDGARVAIGTATDVLFAGLAAL
jgi:hypothetical protein